MSKQKVFKGVITYKIEKGHPDIQYVKNVENELQYDDIYTINCDRFDNDEEAMINFIKQDLSLVAGGGYSTEHLCNVKFNVQRIG